MSKKDSSSKPGKDENAVADDSAEAVVDGETGAVEQPDPGAGEDSGAEAGAETGADTAKPSAAGSEAQKESSAQAGDGSEPQTDPADRSGADANADTAESPQDGAGTDKALASEAPVGPGSKNRAADEKPSKDGPPKDGPAKEKPPKDGPPKDGPPKEKSPKPRRSWFGLFNFLLILGLAGGAYYYWTLERQRLADQRATLADLESRLETRVTGSRLDSGLSSLRSEIENLGRKIGELETGQQGLRESSETLYELFGRDRADWQLAEVEYLMRVAQHKLILENDFAGAAATLQAASDRIGLTGDPGLLPVRVTISEEIAELKTRERPDLVGMTLTLARLARQVRTLTPGFAPRIDETAADDGLPQVQPPEDWRDRVARFIDSLVEVRHESSAPTEIEASVANVGETLEDNLKLARWAVLDRDGRQYAELIDQSLRLMREYYDLDNAANHEFMTELQALQKMQISPDKPDITGSLRQMQRILSQRENAPEAAPEAANGEPVDG